MAFQINRSLKVGHPAAVGPQLVDCPGQSQRKSPRYNPSLMIGSGCYPRETSSHGLSEKGQDKCHGLSDLLLHHKRTPDVTLPVFSRLRPFSWSVICFTEVPRLPLSIIKSRPSTTRLNPLLPFSYVTHEVMKTSVRLSLFYSETQRCYFLSFCHCLTGCDNRKSVHTTMTASGLGTKMCCFWRINVV